ncbi:hypothetical protein GCM10009639_16270 [Kitasatospora putterlickiae]|uniref:SRPBCC domain-containing protein n=1 Tax=Kitasatospora putterlickiae TaxID=221725 RepID=A0ABN1XSJ3_9ACTN
MVAGSIEREITIAAPRSRVWEVLTRAEFLNLWFGTVTPALIEQLNPPTTLALRHPRHTTLVTFTLTTEPGDHTRLRLLESGLPSPASPRGAALPHFDQHATDWTRRLTEFACHTERLTLRR